MKDEKGNTVATGTNAADGKITFKPITYSLTDAGKTYTYTVSEKQGIEPGVTYDTAPKTVKVTVGKDNGDGTLADSTVKYPDDGLVFTNTYDAKGSVTLEGTK